MKHDLILERLGDPAQELDDAPEIIARRLEARWLDALVVEHRIGEAVGAIDDEDMIVVEEGREPQTDQMMHPVGIEIVVKLQDDIARGRDVFQFAQHALSAIGDRLGEEATLLLQLDVVGTFGSGQDGDHDAHDRDEDDETDRRGADGARPSVQSALTVLRESRQSLSPHGRPPRDDHFVLPRPLACRACERLEAVLGGRRAVLRNAAIRPRSLTMG